MKEKILIALSGITGLKMEEIHLETPENEEFGDYSSNIALRIKGRNPREVAEEFVAKLKNDKDLLEIVEKIEIAGPGFINFWLSKTLLTRKLQEILNEGDKYSKSDLLKNKKIMVEFAHPNTHKELHIGHMRTLILGESLARILEASSANVFRANYQGDVGPHVAKAIWGTEKILGEKGLSWDDAEKMALSEKVHLLGSGYVRGSMEYETSKEVIDQLNVKLYQKDPKIVPTYEKTRGWSLEYYEDFYKRFDTYFDRLYFESEVAGPGKEIVEKNIGKIFEKSEGAIIFDGDKYGLHKRVFITKDGNPTYEAKEMALALLQFSDFPFDLNIHVVANEQKGYFQVVIKALELIDGKFKGREYHLPMGMVNLVGKKMSSRTGEIYTVDQLLEDIKSLVRPLVKKEDLSESEREEIAEKVTVGAVKYSMLKTSPTMDVSFDLKQSVSLEGNSGPYLQYTIARTNSVLAKIPNNKFQITNKTKIPSSKMNKEELSLLRAFVHYSEAIEQAAENYSPNLLCNYLFDLAQKFNSFYSKHWILQRLNEDVKSLDYVSPEAMMFRLRLTSATGQVLKTGVNLLGIQAPERM